MVETDTKANTQCQGVLLEWMCWTHPSTGAGSSLGSHTAAVQWLNIHLQDLSAHFCSEWNLLGCIWLSQPLPWVSKVQFRLFSPEQLQGLLQLNRSWGGFERCRINEALLWLICLLHLDSVPCWELSCASSFPHNVQSSLFIFHMNSCGFTQAGSNFPLSWRINEGNLTVWQLLGLEEFKICEISTACHICKVQWVRRVGGTNRALRNQQTGK